MHRSMFVRACLALTVLAGSTAATLAQEVEPNNLMASATTITLGGATTTVSGAYNTQGDVDFYRIFLPQRVALRIRLGSPTAGACTQGVDPYVQLLQSNGTLIAEADDVITPGQPVSMCPDLDPTRFPGAASLAAGDYYIKVDSFGAPAGTAYQLTIDVLPGSEPLQPRFSYQGVLSGEAGGPVNGTRDMMFTLYNHPDSTLAFNRVSLPIEAQNVEVTRGLFNVELDFTAPGMPPVWNGDERYLEIAVKNQQGQYVTLSPRQRLAPSPATLFAHSAVTANTATVALSAQTAVNAQYAAQAGSVPWSEINGMPAGFVDGVDNGSSWVEAPSTTSTTRAVAINSSLAQGFNLFVNGTVAKPGGGSWTAACDSRFKHDIRPMSGTLETLLSMRGYRFVYNEDVVARGLGLPGEQIGLLADEVEKVFPQWVERDASGFRFVTERATTALMVEALRDLRAEKDRQIQELAAEREALAKRVERLERLLDSRAAH